jgi:hypothetical protein
MPRGLPFVDLTLDISRMRRRRVLRSREGADGGAFAEMDALERGRATRTKIEWSATTGFATPHRPDRAASRRSWRRGPDREVRRRRSPRNDKAAERRAVHEASSSASAVLRSAPSSFPAPRLAARSDARAFFDNTDPDGIDRTLLGNRRRCSRNADRRDFEVRGTKETRNGMLEAKGFRKGRLGSATMSLP